MHSHQFRRSAKKVQSSAGSTEEAGRLEILQQLDVSSAATDAVLGHIVNAVANALGVPISTLTQEDPDQEWLHASVGLEGTVCLSRDYSFAARTLSDDVVFEVDDARSDVRFCQHPFVAGPPFVRSFAVSPLWVRGHRIGALCVMDTVSRCMSSSERSFLTSMAASASRLLEAHLIEVERDRALKLACESEERLRFALESAGIGDWDMNLQTNVARRSLMHDRCFGYADAVTEWGYDTFLNHVHVDDRERVNQHFQTAMTSFGSYNVEFKCVWPDTSTHWLWTKGRFYADDQGQPYRVAGILVDVTPRVQAEAQRASLESQVREAQKHEAIGTLAGGIAHDFNNILGIILGNTKLAAGDALSNPSIQMSLNEIEKAGLRGRDLVQQILAFSRKQPTNRVTVNPKQLLEDMTRLLRPLLPAQVSLVLDLYDDTPCIDADRVQIDQVLMNLVTNAAHAMASRPGEIRIEARGCLASCLATDPQIHREVPCLLISVIDNGVGMDDETKQHLFEPFFTTKPVGEGTGLGLAVAHGIVTRHGGKIVVDSAPGAGTRFDLFFPVAAAKSDAAAPFASMPSGSSLEPKGRVLYIDDDDALVFLITRLLERSGHEVKAFVSSHDARELLRTTDQHFDVVISDYNMPGDNGIEVLKEVVALRPGVSVALISGYITDAMRDEALSVGISEIVFKPDSPQELAAAMQRLLRNKPTISP